MNQQEYFLQKITELKEVSRLQGHTITREQADLFIEENQLNEMQTDYFYEYLKENKIGIGDAARVELNETDTGYLDLYLEELKDLPTYSESEKRAFMMGALNGEALAISSLIQAYLPYVADIAKLYSGQGVMLEDLIGEGNVALSSAVYLLGAVESVDEVEGFLAQQIMNAMEDAIGEDALQRKKAEKTLNKVNKVADKAREMASELRRSVTIDELMSETGFGEKEIRDAIRMSGHKIEDIDETAGE